ncbi:MAG: HEAT repeat domain-containing protein [Myxococcales bacterium]|nr:HEAT repeat domain-containing protein [Myxococcales bacterium]
MTLRRRILIYGVGVLAVAAGVGGLLLSAPEGDPIPASRPDRGGPLPERAPTALSTSLGPTKRAVAEEATAPGDPALRATTPAPSPAVVRSGRYLVDVVSEVGGRDEQQGTVSLGPEELKQGGTWRASRLVDSGGDAVLGAIRLASDGTFDVCLTRPQDDGALGLRLCAATAALSLGRSPQPEATEWRTQEGAERGWSEVQYRRSGDVITKTWTGAPGVPNLELRGRTEVALGREGVVSVELTEEGVMGEGASVLSFNTRSVARWSGPEHGLDLAALDLTALLPPRPSRGEPPPDPPARPFEEVIGDLKAGARSDRPSRRSEVRDELTYAIRASVVAVGAARELLATETLDDAERPLLVAALVGAESAASEAAVLELLLNRARSSALRVDLLNAVTLMQHPTPAMAESLVRMAASGEVLAHGAAVAAGGISSRLDDAAREATVTALIAAAGAILTPQGTGPDPFLANQRAGTRAAWVDALGNTADPRILPLVGESLNEPSPMVRAAAADALRFLRSPSCARIMEEAMLTEHSVHVRGRLVMAASKMGPERMGSFVERALFKDESGYVRRTAAFVAAMWSSTAPGYLEVLAKALKEEKEPDVAEAISNHLNSNEIHGDEAMRVEMLPAEEGDGMQEVEETP